MFVALTVSAEVWADYTIAFKSTDGADGNAAQTTIANLISSGDTNVSSISASKAYNGKSGYGVKLGSSGDAGYVNMTLATDAQIQASKLVVKAAYYDSGKTLKVTVTYTDNTTTTQTIPPSGSLTDYDVSLTDTKTIKSIKIESVTASKGRMYCHSIKVVAASAAPSYTVTATSNNDNYGTVSVSGTTITASPKTGYTYANPAYTVTAGTASVAQSSNTFTVTPSTNCTIRINFTEKVKNTYVDNVQGNSTQTLYDTHAAPSLTDKAQATTGTCEQQHWHFMGWVTEANKENPTDDNIVKAGASVTANGTTYYAVWVKGTTTGGGSTSKQYTFDITKGNFNTTSYVANNNSKTSTAKASDNSTKSVSWTSNQVMQQSSTMQWQSSKGYIYNTTDLGNITNITITSTAGTFTTYYGTSPQPSQKTSVGTGNGYFQIKVGSATGKVSNIKVTFTQTVAGETTTTYSDYITTCTAETTRYTKLSI